MTIDRGILNLPTDGTLSVKYILDSAFHPSEYLFSLNLPPSVNIFFVREQSNQVTRFQGEHAHSSQGTHSIRKIVEFIRTVMDWCKVLSFGVQCKWICLRISVNIRVKGLHILNETPILTIEFLIDALKSSSTYPSMRRLLVSRLAIRMIIRIHS